MLLNYFGYNGRSSMGKLGQMPPPPPPLPNTLWRSHAAMLLIKIATKLCVRPRYENMHVLLAFITNYQSKPVKLAVKLPPSTFVRTKRL